MTSSTQYISRCLELAEKGGRLVQPNPMVGCVLVSKGEVIAEGYHKVFGGPHAEVKALSSLSSVPSDAVLYVNLEPCSHHGKTPPCADLIIEKGIKKVVIGALDINPKVSGSGVAKLKESGIEVEAGVLVDKCVETNKRFYINHKLNRPYIVLKWAETRDGFIARDDYSSKWISGEDSRKLVHQFRSQEAAILVGTNTARYDNPSLTVRHVDGVNPTRIVFDRKLSLSSDLKLFSGEVRTIIVNEVKDENLPNVEFLKMDFEDDFLSQLLRKLLDMGLSSIFIEGGAKTLQSFIDVGLWDEAFRFTGTESFGSGISAPKLNFEASKEDNVGQDLLRYYYNDYLAEVISVLKP